MAEYQELNKLIDFCTKFNVYACKLAEQHGDFSQIRLSFGSKVWIILCDDDYQDLREQSTYMNVFLALRELEIYKEEDDFLTWSNQNGGRNLLEYYRSLDATLMEIETILGSIDQFISDFDYELRTGVIKELADLSPRDMSSNEV